MVNIWNYINNYIRQQNNSYTYNKQDTINELLNYNEQQIYEYLQKSDLERLRRFS